MQIAIVSGKGGAGKTTLATRLFMSTGGVLLDCDTEAPNAAIFFDLSNRSEEVVETRHPVIGDECTNCGACARFCAFGAILSAPTATIPLVEKCHDCGGCFLVCPESAIRYDHRPMGRIQSADTEYGSLKWGELNIGEYSGVRIVRKLRNDAPMDAIVWIDGPPGTSCSAVAAVEDADYAILVGEPTPFGLSDMAMAGEMLESLKVPFGVVVNKVGTGDQGIQNYCHQEGLPLLGEIPFDRSVAESLATGKKGWYGSEQVRFREISDRVFASINEVTK